MENEDVLHEFRNAQALLHGHFILTSGLHSPVYLQCARVMMDPARGARICAALAERVRAALGDEPIDAVVSPAMGGIIVGYELARQLALPSMFVERQDGVFAMRRGFEIAPGARILVVEDVVTTGKSSRECMACIADHGGAILAEACLIDRSGGKADVGVPLIALAEIDAPTYSEDNLPAELAAIPAVKPGSRVFR